MARKIVHQLTDDLDGTVIEHGSGDTVVFSLDGVAYEIDLTNSNAEAFRSVLEPYIKAGRRLARSSASATPRRRTAASRSGRDVGAIRSWANENGFTVSDRGRVPSTVLEAYDAAH